MTERIWEKNIDKATLLDEFMDRLSKYENSPLYTYPELYKWSVEKKESFWEECWDFFGVVGQKSKQILQKGDYMYQDKWFEDSRLNYAENLLRYDGEIEALISYNELGERQSLSWDDLKKQVACVANFLKEQGIQKGDIVGGYLPNCIELVVAMLATTSLGGVWASCSPDFGISSLLDRFGQIHPKLLFTTNGYYYAGKIIPILEKVNQIVEGIPSIKKVIQISFIPETTPPNYTNWEDIIHTEKKPVLFFEPMFFNDPLFILFSSGTTGKPKCIVHGIGGTLLQHYKEHQLHCDIHPGDVLFFYTSCGWMMWNWMVSALGSGATLILFDGQPLYPKPLVLWDFIDAEKITHFGISPRYLYALEQYGLAPKNSHNLQSLRMLLSTGAPLHSNQYDYVYDKIKTDVCLASISGGTDIISSFVLGCMNLPVFRGEIACAGLGMDLVVFDENGKECINTKGELVCKQSFPSMPIYFFDDDKQKTKYRKSYFEVFSNIWTHGDYAEKTTRDTFIIYGRSDSVLNPSGVRIGTAEIYSQLQNLSFIIENVVIGQHWEQDIRIVLFVKLEKGVILDTYLKQIILKTIVENTSPRHTPKKIIAVSDIPKTINGKISEKAVYNVVHGNPISNLDALINPQCLSQYQNIKELEEA